MHSHGTRVAEPKSVKPLLASLLAQGVENLGAAHAKAKNGSQGRDHHQVRAKVHDVGQYGGHCEDQSQNIEPERGSDFSAHILAKAKLQQERGKSDGRDDDQGERAGESGAAGINHHQSEREEQEPGGNDTPTAGLGCGIGGGVGQGVPPQVIQGGVRVFQIERGRLLRRQSLLGQLFCRDQRISGLHPHIRFDSRPFPVGSRDRIDDSNTGNVHGEVIIDAMTHSQMTTA